jgi:hypothetical protein
MNMPLPQDETGATENKKPYAYILGMRFDAATVEKIDRVLRVLVIGFSLYWSMGFLLVWIPADLRLYEDFGIQGFIPFSLLFLCQYRYLFAVLCAGVFLYFCGYRKKIWPIWLMPLLALSLAFYYISVFPSFRLISLP